jgi:hypothetical protein
MRFNTNASSRPGVDDSCFIPCYRDQGFDSRNDPIRWQMVPLHGERYVYLHDAMASKLQSSRSDVLKIEEIATNAIPCVPNQTLSTSANESIQQKICRAFKLTGNSPGSTEIEVIDGHTKKAAKLFVNVVPERNVNVAFNFVGDTSGHCCTYLRALHVPWLNRVNEIFNYQANVVATCVEVKEIDYQGNMGDPIELVELDKTFTHSAKEEEVFRPTMVLKPSAWSKIRNMGSQFAHVNFFMVNDFYDLEDDTLGRTFSDGWSPQIPSAMSQRRIDRDPKVRVGQVLAHELCHALIDGLENDHTEGRFDLMQKKYREGSIFLDEKTIRRIHRIW